MSKYYIDCEFDGHNGPLLSMAMVAENNGFGIYMRTFEKATDPWVVANVMSVADKHEAHIAFACPEDEFGGHLLYVMNGDKSPTIIADSPVDIARFCRAISTAADGSWASVDGNIKFEVHDVAAYPTCLVDAVQHNAWWDAMALRVKLEGEAG